MGKNAIVTIRIAEDMKERLEVIAAKKDVAVSQLIREAIKEYFQKQE